MSQKLKIGIVGMGNVGVHFLQRLIDLGYSHVTVYSRSGNNLPASMNVKDVQFTNCLLYTSRCV